MKKQQSDASVTFQKNGSYLSENKPYSQRNTDDITEHYLNHPTFGLLYSVCPLEDNQEVFTSLYAMRHFFLVTASATSTTCEPIGRTNVRQRVETRLRHLRRIGQHQEYNKLQAIYQQTF